MFGECATGTMFVATFLATFIQRIHRGSGRALLGLGVFMLGCGADTTQDDALRDDRARERFRMVEKQIRARGIRDPRVLEALRRVPRHAFVPESERQAAYEDRPLAIGFEQTISQPYIVALMSEALELKGNETVLEIGTGSGYQAAVLAQLAAQVYTIEIVPELAARAERVLQSLGITNVHVRAGDGYRGWPEVAPFDAIMVTASPDHVPQPLVEQLVPGGTLVMPVGTAQQVLVRMQKTGTGITADTLAAVRFVPMTGEALEKHEP